MRFLLLLNFGGQLADFGLENSEWVGKKEVRANPTRCLSPSARENEEASRLSKGEVTRFLVTVKGVKPLTAGYLHDPCILAFQAEISRSSAGRGFKESRIAFGGLKARFHQGH